MSFECILFKLLNPLGKAGSDGGDVVRGIFELETEVDQLHKLYKMVVINTFLELVVQENRPEVKKPKRPGISRAGSTILCNVGRSRTKCCGDCRATGSCCSTDCIPYGRLQLVRSGSFIEPFVIAGPQKNEILDNIFVNEMHKVVGERVGKEEGRKTRENGNTLDPVFFREPILGGRRVGELNLVCLFYEFVMRAKRKISGIIGFYAVRISDVRVAGTVEGNIVSRSASMGNTEAANAAHAAGRNTVVALHTHDH